jgi:WD40 repeat protein
MRALLAALLLAPSTYAAGDKPLVLKTLQFFPAGVSDGALTLVATPSGSAINLWSPETGSQIGRIQVPTKPDEDPLDKNFIIVHAVRPDLDFILISVQHYYNRGEKWRKKSTQILLASIKSEKFKTVWSVEGPCADFGGIGDSSSCMGPAEKNHIALSPDAKEISIESTVIYPDHLKGDYFTGRRSLVFDLSGKKLFDNEIARSGGGIVKGSEKTYVSPSAAGAAEIITDEQSCSVARGGKRQSFLKGCTSADSPSVNADGTTAISEGKQVLKIWDAATGALKTSLDAGVPPKDFEHAWTVSANGRTAAVVTRIAYNAVTPGTIQIWDVESGERLGIGSGPEFSLVQSVKLSPDGRRILLLKTDVFTLADLGLDGSPSPPVPVSTAKRINVDELPAFAAMPVDPNAVAVVVGVEKYRQAGVPVVDYAARDAKTITAYLTGAMGFDPVNVATLTDAQAGKADFDKYFGKWLLNRTGPKSRVFIFYAGHGAPNPTTGAGYLMPYEADPGYLDETAYPIARLYAELAKLPTKDVTVVLDACFSGQGERSLIAKGTRPLVAVQSVRAPDYIAVIAAASGTQISSSDHETRHGLLTYHLLAGLHGGADANHDKIITAAEAFAYARPAVQRAAKLQNVEQNPTVSGETTSAGTDVWIKLKKL